MDFLEAQMVGLHKTMPIVKKDAKLLDANRKWLLPGAVANDGADATTSTRFMSFLFKGKFKNRPLEIANSTTKMSVKGNLVQPASLEVKGDRNLPDELAAPVDTRNVQINIPSSADRV